MQFLSMRPVRSLFLLMAVMGVSLSGCVRHRSGLTLQQTIRENSSGARQLAAENEIVFTCRSEGNDVILESEQLILVFPKVRRIERTAFDGEEFWVQVGGEGSSEVARSHGRNFGTAKFHARYKDGVSTIQFCGREVRLENAARKVIVGEQVFELTPEEKMVRVLANAN